MVLQLFLPYLIVFILAKGNSAQTKDAPFRFGGLIRSSRSNSVLLSGFAPADLRLIHEDGSKALVLAEFGLKEGQTGNRAMREIQDAYFANRVNLSMSGLAHYGQFRLDRIFLVDGSTENITRGQEMPVEDIMSIKIAKSGWIRVNLHCATSRLRVDKMVPADNVAKLWENEWCTQAFQKENMSLKISTMFNLSPYTRYSKEKGKTNARVS